MMISRSILDLRAISGIVSRSWELSVDSSELMIASHRLIRTLWYNKLLWISRCLLLEKLVMVDSMKKREDLLDLELEGENQLLWCKLDW